jgi:hypothetical protein
MWIVGGDAYRPDVLPILRRQTQTGDTSGQIGAIMAKKRNSVSYPGAYRSLTYVGCPARVRAWGGIVKLKPRVDRKRERARIALGVRVGGSVPAGAERYGDKT